MDVRALRIATRGSPLALWQANEVARRLVAARVCSSCELVVRSTVGDERTDLAIAEIARQGVFTSEIDHLVASGRADVAVHSAKDLPSSAPEDGLVIGAVPVRADVRDALVGLRLAQLTPGTRVATGSVRRRVQLGVLAPGLQFVELRGNIATRLRKVPEGGAGLFAAAGLDRLGLREQVAQRLETSEMLPQAGQGAIAVKCRADDEALRKLLESIDDADAHRALIAERSYLGELGGGCDAPIGAFATTGKGGEVELEVMYASLDGGQLLRRSGRGTDPVALGKALAKEVLDAFAQGGDLTT